MSNTPFKEQKLPLNHLAFVQASIAAGDAVAGADLILAIEQIIGGPVPEEARNFLRLAVIPAVKTRGRPKKFGAALDLALETVDRRYPALLRYEERRKRRAVNGGKTVSKGAPPSALAYERLLRHMKIEFGPMTWEALRNMHSEWRNGHFHSTDSQVTSEDFDAEIDRRFPAPRRNNNK